MATDSKSKRLRWIDVAKGMAIILIVMHHARDYALSLAPLSPDNVFRWAYIDPQLLYIRLPLFFLISGMLASGMFSTGGQGYNVRRTAKLASAYVLWALVMAVIVPFWPNEGGGWISDPVGVVQRIVRGESVVWYLWAVAMAFGVAFATRHLPAWAAGILVGMLSFWLQSSSSDLGGAFGRLGHYLPFYCVGIRYPGELTRLAEWRDPRGLILFVAGYFVLLSPNIMLPGIDVIREILGVGVGLVAASWAAERWPKGTGCFAWLGRRTLPVYVLHFPIMAAMGCSVIRHRETWVGQPVAISLFSPLLAAATIAISLTLFMAIRALGGGWLFAMPLRRSAARTERPVGHAAHPQGRPDDHGLQGQPWAMIPPA